MTRSNYVTRRFKQISNNCYVSSTQHPSVLVQIGTELLQNKTNSHPSQCPWYNLLWRCHFYWIFVYWWDNYTFWKLQCSNSVRKWHCQSFCLDWLQLQCIEFDLKVNNFFHTCSVATDLVTSLQFHSHFCYYAAVPFPAIYGPVPESLCLTSIAALLQALLQLNTEPL